MNQSKSKELLLKQLYDLHKKCLTCPLKNHNIVYGHGNANAQFMLIGEAPGKNEDEQSLPFVGKSGILLTKALASIGIERKNIFITNSVKCRPPNNRKPTRQEIKIYKNLLLKEIEIIQPYVICTLGTTAFECLFEIPAKMTAIHGTTMPFNSTIVIPTYHPAYILRSQNKYKAWLQDLEKAWLLANQIE